jgi:hypothetical protein
LHDYAQESPAISALVKNWSKTELTAVNSMDANANTMDLANGRTISYKSLVLAPNFDTSYD